MVRRFLDRVRDETGIDVRVVDGQDEAALTFRGVAADTDLTGSVVVADIGGGSTELISARDGVMQMVRSLPLGSGPADRPFRGCRSTASR